MINSPPRINIDFVGPFIDGTINTLQIQCSSKVEPKKPFLKGNGPELNSDISAVIGLTSAVFTGTIAICFPETIFLTIMERMLGEKCPAITKELEDGAGELLNMIFGQAKLVLNQKGYGIHKALPSIVRGSYQGEKKLSPQVTLVLPFNIDHGTFFIEVHTE